MLGKNHGKVRSRRKRSPASASGTKTERTDGFDSSNPPFNGCLPVTVPRKIGSDVATIHLPNDVEPKSVEVVLHFSSVAKQLLFQLEPCIFFERRAKEWIEPLVMDPAYLHTMLFTTQYYFDAIQLGRTPFTTQRTLPHYLKALELLRERVSSDSDPARLSYTTIAAVMALAGHSHWSGDVKSARNHMEGLCKIVSLRGGVGSFKDNAKLLVEVFRVDIGMALHSGSRPVFYSSSQREPFPPYPDLSSLLELRKDAAVPYARYNPTNLLDDLSEYLAQAWKVMSDFCSLINFAVSSGQRISTETFLDTMVSTMYRLLDMRFETGSCNEAVRLGLLAFSGGVFLQWKSLGMTYPYLACQFRDCLAGLSLSSFSSRVMLWLLMIGAVSLFDHTDDDRLLPTLRSHLAACEINEWSQMRELLGSFMWIELVYDKPGKRVFDSAMAISASIDILPTITDKYPELSER